MEFLVPGSWGAQLAMAGVNVTVKWNGEDLTQLLEYWRFHKRLSLNYVVLSIDIDCHLVSLVFYGGSAMV